MLKNWSLNWDSSQERVAGIVFQGTCAFGPESPYSDLRPFWIREAGVPLSRTCGPFHIRHSRDGTLLRGAQMTWILESRGTY